MRQYAIKESELEEVLSRLAVLPYKDVYRAISILTKLRKLLPEEEKPDVSVG